MAEEHAGIAKLKEKSRAIRSIFDNPAGRRVLEILSEQFDSDDLRGKTVEETYYKLGQRDALVFIRQMIKLTEKTNG